MAKKNLTVLHFLLQDIQVCMDLRFIQKVLPLPLLKKIPASPIYFVGLMNVKGKCIPILDLAICANLFRDQPYSLNVPILLCAKEEQQIGLIVDKIIGLGEIDEETIEIHKELTSYSSPFLGAVTLETNISLLINITWVFTLKLTQEINQFCANHE